MPAQAAVGGSAGGATFSFGTKATAAASGVLLAGTDTESTTVSDGNVVSVRQVVTVAALAASVRVGDPDLTLSATVS